MDYSKYIKDLKMSDSSFEEYEQLFKEEMLKMGNYIARLCNEKLVLSEKKNLVHFKTLMANAFANMMVTSEKLSSLFPEKADIIRGAIIIALGPFSILISNIVTAMLLENKNEVENRDSVDTPKISGAWYDKPDRNSN